MIFRLTLSTVMTFGAVSMGMSADHAEISTLEKPRILQKAGIYMNEEPRTVTVDQCERSAGGIHDFYSEGDYWWPNPDDPDGRYIRRDGETNPDNFVAHMNAFQNELRKLDANENG